MKWEEIPDTKEPSIFCARLFENKLKRGERNLVLKDFQGSQKNVLSNIRNCSFKGTPENMHFTSKTYTKLKLFELDMKHKFKYTWNVL